MNTASALTQAFPRRTRRPSPRCSLLDGTTSQGFSSTRSIRAIRCGTGCTCGRAIPVANRAAIAEPFEQLVVMLRDPSITIPNRTLRDVMAFATHPTSPAYGGHPAQAGAAHALVDEVRVQSVEAAHA